VNRRLIGLAAFLAVLLTFIFARGEPDPPPRRLSVPWRITRIVADRYIYFAVIGGGCKDLASVEVVESETAVEATAWSIGDVAPDVYCTLELTVDVDIVILDRPLGERRIVPGPLSRGIDRESDEHLFDVLEIERPPPRCPQHPVFGNIGPNDRGC